MIHTDSKYLVQFISNWNMSRHLDAIMLEIMINLKFWNNIFTDRQLDLLKSFYITTLLKKSDHCVTSDRSFGWYKCMNRFIVRVKYHGPTLRQTDGRIGNKLTDRSDTGYSVLLRRSRFVLKREGWE